MASTSDNRDAQNLRQFLYRSRGIRAYAPALRRAPGNAICDCMIDPVTGQSYCMCSSIITTDMAFGPDKISAMINPMIRFATPCERAALKRRTAFIAKSWA